jgi:glycosyltransferase involved in cell wall biosynthesis
MRHADSIIANAPLACAKMESAFPAQRAKFTTITNGFDPDGAPAGPLVGRAQKIQILHAGEINYGRDPRPFLDAISAIEHEQPGWSRGVEVRFVGTAHGMASNGGLGLQGEIARRRLDDTVRVQAWTPYAEVLRAMADADILLMLDTPGRLAGIPAKAYEYLGTGRSIMALSERDGDVAWLLRESGCQHRMAPPQDSASIKQALFELVSEIQSGNRPPSQLDRILRFTREHLTKDLVNVLNSCVSTGGRAGAMLPAARNEALSWNAAVAL